MSPLANAACGPALPGPKPTPTDRRRPEQTVLYRVVQEHWPAFLEQTEQAGGVPKFVATEIETYLKCGLPEYGCALLACEACGQTRLCAFSCKRRGFVPAAWAEE